MLPVSGALQFTHSDRVLSQCGSDMGEVKVLQSFACFCIRKEKIPKPICLRPALKVIQYVFLTRRQTPPITVVRSCLLEFRCSWLNFRGNEMTDGCEQGFRLSTHRRIVKVGLDVGCGRVAYPCLRSYSSKGTAQTNVFTDEHTYLANSDSGQK